MGLIDRLLILTMGIVTIAFMDVSITSMVVATLIFLLCGILSEILEDRKFEFIEGIVFGIIIIIYDMAFPVWLFFVYEMARGIIKKRFINAISFVITASVYIIMIICERDCRYLLSNGTWLFFAIILSIYMAYNSIIIEKLKREKLKLRDDNEEFMRLESSRRALLVANQDSEVQMATLKERNRIAREIHDNVGHLLSRCILQLGAISTIHKNEPVSEELKAVQAGLDESMNSIRSSVHDLHNEALDLEKTIRRLIEANKDFITSFEYDVENDIPMKIKYCMISIVTEGYQNAIKHSNGNQVDIIVREHPGLYQLMFCDNGTGAQLKENGIGLHNMEERIRELSGTISFSVEVGFRIFVSIPKEVRQ